MNTTQELHENDIVLAAMRGDSQAVSDIYRRYVDTVYKFVYYRVGNREEAEDLTSDIFIKMMHALPSFSFDSKFKTWLLGIAKHTVLDYFRKHYKNRTLALDDFLNVDLGNALAIQPVFDFDEDQKESESITKRLEEKVRSVLSKLPKNYREVLELRFLKGYSIRETAEELGKTISNIKVLQYRALHRAQELGAL